MLSGATSLRRADSMSRVGPRSSQVTFPQGHRQALESVSNQDREMGHGMSVCTKS